MKNPSWQAVEVEKDHFILSLDNHAEIVSAIQDFCEKFQIKNGMVSGIGAVGNAVLRFFNPDTKKYVDKSFDEQMEIANLTGNISTLEDKVYLHLHTVLGRGDCSAIAGHLLKSVIHGAGEFYIRRFDYPVSRKFSDEIGLNLYLLSGGQK